VGRVKPRDPPKSLHQTKNEKDQTRAQKPGTGRRKRKKKKEGLNSKAFGQPKVRDKKGKKKESGWSKLGGGVKAVDGGKRENPVRRRLKKGEEPRIINDLACRSGEK